MSHTPAPWQVIGPRKTHVHQKDTPRLIAECGGEFADEREIDQANARLIAAAPDLLAALKRAVAACDTSVNWTMWESALAAIAKAEGAS